MLRPLGRLAGFLAALLFVAQATSRSSTGRGNHDSGSTRCSSPSCVLGPARHIASSRGGAASFSKKQQDDLLDHEDEAFHPHICSGSPYFGLSTSEALKRIAASSSSSTPPVAKPASKGRERLSLHSSRSLASGLGALALAQRPRSGLLLPDAPILQPVEAAWHLDVEQNQPAVGVEVGRHESPHAHTAPARKQVEGRGTARQGGERGFFFRQLSTSLSGVHLGPRAGCAEDDGNQLQRDLDVEVVVPRHRHGTGSTDIGVATNLNNTLVSGCGEDEDQDGSRSPSSSSSGDAVAASSPISCVVVAAPARGRQQVRHDHDSRSEHSSSRLPSPIPFRRLRDCGSSRHAGDELLKPYMDAAVGSRGGAGQEVLRPSSPIPASPKLERMLLMTEAKSRSKKRTITTTKQQQLLLRGHSFSGPSGSGCPILHKTAEPAAFVVPSSSSSGARTTVSSWSQEVVSEEDEDMAPRSQHNDRTAGACSLPIVEWPAAGNHLGEQFFLTFLKHAIVGHDMLLKKRTADVEADVLPVGPPLCPFRSLIRSRSSSHDHDLSETEQRCVAAAKELRSFLYQCFAAYDQDSSGTVSRASFHDLIEDAAAAARFHGLMYSSFDPKAAPLLRKLRAGWYERMDVDGSGRMGMNTWLTVVMDHIRHEVEILEQAGVQ